MADVLCFGETMAMLVAEQCGDLDQVTHFHRRIAGADSNVAIGLARLGFDVTWLSRVGNDSLGRFVLQSLRAEGLDCQHVAVDPLRPTGFQFKGRTDDGSDPQVEYYRRGSAASQLSIADLPERQPLPRHLHVTGIPPALSAATCELTDHLLLRQRQAGGSSSFDPNLRPQLWASERQMVETLNHLAGHADWVLPGLAEGSLLTGYQTPQDIAAFYLDRGAQAVAIKLGAAGAYYRTARDQSFVAAQPVARVVDTVGAGDGFAVGLVSALLEGQPLLEAVKRGNWIGSRAVQSRGDMEGLPRRSELALTA